MKAYIVAFDSMAKKLAAGFSELEYIVAELKKSLPVRTRGAGLIPANVQGKYLQAAK